MAMPGFLAAKERCENMKQRLDHYRRMSAAANAQFVIPPTEFEPVKAAEKQKQQASPKPAAAPKSPSPAAAPKTQAAPAPSATPVAAVGSLFGIPLTRDNCLIMALIIMLIKEQADMRLIIALLYLLL
jgi:hypothetical protein